MKVVAPDPSWGSHLLALARCFDRAPGDVLELGAGMWSTPFLARLCAVTKRRLVSVEPTLEWNTVPSDPVVREFCANQAVPTDENGPRWGVLDITPWSGDSWSLALVDCGPRAEERASLVRRLRGLATFVVVHDVDRIDCPGYEDLRPTIEAWKYARYWRPEGMPWTVALSDLEEP